MFRFLPGIIILQLLTVAFVLLLPDTLESFWSWLQLLLPTFAIAVMTAFWFDAIAAQLNQEKINQLQKEFGNEREKIRVNAERSKVRLLKQNHKQVAKETRDINAKANFKVGAMTAGAIGVGVVLMTVQLLTMGMMVLMTTGGVLTGYAVRARQEKTGKLPFSKIKLPFKKAHKRLP
jgi:Flp pilus assembly protein TadB